MRNVLIVLVLVIASAVSVEFGWLGVSPISGPRDIKDIEVVIVNAKVPRHPFQYEYEEMLYPTVRISAGYSTGTGVIIATTHSLRSVQADKPQITQIITAAHVVSDETTVNIEFYDSTIITGTVVITDTVKDLALIKPQINTDYADKIKGAKLAPKNYTPYIFTPVWAVGCSLGLNPRPSAGHITAINTDSWEISAPILPGNSGGPVYDARTYEVIGIAVWVKVYDGQLITTMAGIVPINQVYQFLNSHRDTEVTEECK